MPQTLMLVIVFMCWFVGLLLMYKDKAVIRLSGGKVVY